MNRKLMAALGISAVVALNACGSSTDSNTAARITTPSPAAVPTTPSRQAPAGAVDGQALTSRMVDAMIAAKTAHTTLNISGAPSGEGDYEFSNPVKFTMSMSRQGLNMEIVQVGGVTYIKGIPAWPSRGSSSTPRGPTRSPS